MITDFEEDIRPFNGVETSLPMLIAKRFLPFWPLFLILSIIAIATAFFYLRYTAPVYQVNAKLLVKDEKKGMDASNVLDALNVFGEKKIVENETEILRSWPLMKEVVAQLHLYTSQVRTGKFRNTELYGNYAPLRFVAINKDSIRPLKKPVDIFINRTKGTFILNGISHYFGDTVAINHTRYAVNVNPSLSIDPEYEIADTHILLHVSDIHALANGFIGGLSVAPISKQSTVIGVSLQTTVPDKGVDLINTLFRVYNDAAILDKNIIAQNTLKFVDDRLNLVTKELENVEDNIKDYKTREGIVDMSEQGRLFLETVKENDQKVSELNIQLSVLDDVARYVSGKGANPGTVPSLMGINDATLVQLLTQLYENELQLSRLAKITSGQNDQQLQLKDEIARLKPAILENIRNIRTNFTTARNNLLGTISRSSSLLTQLPGKEKALIEISRQQVIKNSIYSYLLQKREETALSRSSAVADSRVVEPAIAGAAPIKPKPRVIYMIALATGIGLSVLVVLFMESYNRKVLFRSEIEQQIKAPIVGELMFDKKGEQLVVKEGKRTILAEQFRMLRTNMSYLGVDGQNKIIQVSSSISGEGKSYVAANLSIALSLTGKKVVLMELDLRKPKVSIMFGFKKELGITDYLIGLNTLDEILKPVADIHGLSILSSGSIPPNPSELIGSDRFKELIETLKKRFDYIVFDTAPVSLVSDATLLTPFADTTVYVVRHGYTPKAYLGFIQQLQSGKKFKNLSIVFNGIKPRGININGYGYGSAYGYGNGYGYYTDEGENGQSGFLHKTKKFFKRPSAPKE